LPINDNLLKNDHAIYNPLADLKIYFPAAVIYPVLIGQKVSFSELDSLLAKLNHVCGIDCLLVASVDFSHYLPATLADTHDAFTIKNLQNLDVQNITKSEVDSPQSLYLLIKFSILKNAQKWNLFTHTNSGFISNNPDVETTTHIFGFYTRSFLSKSDVYTEVSTPVILDRFYGVDKQTIKPSDSFVISTITAPSKIIRSYLPIKNNLFVLGTKKQQLIKTYFDSLPDNPNLTKDYFWGKLIYGTGYHSTSTFPPQN